MLYAVTFMDISEFESLKTQISATNNFTIPHVDLSIGHYGFEATTTDKLPVTGDGYPTYRLHYIIDGCITLRVGEKTYKLRKNHCFYLRPNIDISYQTDPQRPASLYWVSFTGQNVFYYLERMGFSQNRFFFSIPTKLQPKLHRAFFANFNSSTDTDNLRDLIFFENFMKIVQILALSSSTPPLKKEKENKNYIERAIEIINNRYSDPYLSIKDVAKELFLHENYFSKLFKADMGLTFSAYLSRFRIEMSVALIQKGHNSITQIAYAVGFLDPLYFSKVFKKYNLCTPSEHIAKTRKGKR